MAKRSTFVLLTTTLLVAGASFRCNNKEDLATGQQLDQDGNVLVYNALCDGENINRMSILVEDNTVIWSAEPIVGESPARVVKIGDSPGPGWMVTNGNEVNIVLPEFFYVLVQWQEDDDGHPHQWKDPVATGRLREDQVYLGSPGKYVEPTKFETWYRKNAC